MEFSSPEAYQAALKAHQAAPPMTPLIPTSALPYTAFVLLGTAFLLVFYYTTLPKGLPSSREVGVALGASLCTGFGVVFLFNAVGVYV